MLLGALQENLLVLLSYSEGQARIIRGVVDVALFGGPYRVIAARIYDYLDRFKKPPKDHLADILNDKLESENKRERELYADIVGSIHATQATINEAYVMSQLETFVRRQSLRGVAIELTKALQRDTEDSLDEAEKLMAGANRQSLSLFDPGTRLSDKNKALAFLDLTQACFPTGIPELDRRGFGPTRKELWLFIGNSKAGKTWGLMHVAKMALVHHLRVCHITLEMSEARCSQRYFQALFAIAKRNETLNTTRFEKDELKRITGFETVRITPKLTLDDPQIRKKLEHKVARWGTRLLDNIFIKQFPTGSVTVSQIGAYLDNLEATERFVPDLLVIDYPDLLKHDKANYRLSIDEAYKDIRGIAVARNIAVAVVSQSHRAAAKAKVVGSENVAEAYSKIAHADCIITFSQSAPEQKLGLARLHVAGGRNDQDKITVVISQQYALGAFALDSILMKGNYFGNLPKSEDEVQDE